MYVCMYVYTHIHIHTHLVITWKVFCISLEVINPFCTLLSFVVLIFLKSCLIDSVKPVSTMLR